MPRVTVNDDVEIFYSDQGEGPAVLLLHGWTCDGHDWSALAADLARDHRVIVVDHRGHGRSSVPRGPFGAKVLAHDAAGVLDHLGIDRAVVVGHSMGTLVASALAVEHPGRVTALVLSDPVYGQEDEDLAPLLAGVRAAPVATAAAVFETFYVDASPQWQRTWHLRRLEGTPENVIAEALCALYEGDDGIGRKVIGETYLPRRGCPIFAVYREAGAHLAEWERGLSRGRHDRIEVWPGAGHFVHQEKPEEFAKTMRAWLESLPAGDN